MLEDQVIALLAFIIFCFMFSGFRKDFKIGYYEAKLIHRDVNIERVRKMPWYKIWIE